MMNFTANIVKIFHEFTATLNNSGYAFFDIEAHIICVIILVILLNLHQNSSDHTHSRLIWSRLLFVQFVYCILKFFVILIDINLIPSLKALHSIFKISCSILFIYMCVLFFMYQKSNRNNFDVQNSLVKTAISTTIFAFLGLIQAINWKIPFMCYVLIILDSYMYINYALSLVSVDPLTKIHNRNGFFRNLSERMKKGELENFYVFVVDVDDLRKINASYGRTEGDKVLFLIAAALKKFRNQEHSCYVARYQGDKFLIGADIQNNEELELFEEHIKNYVANLSVSENLKYHLKVNIGRSKYEKFSNTETISGLISEADRNLYANKEQRIFSSMWQN